jgi:hypothetical protein
MGERVVCDELYQIVRLQVFMAADMKIKAFWDVVSCSLVRVDRRFRGAYCLHHQGASSVYYKETTQRYIPEGSNVLVSHRFYW